MSQTKAQLVEGLNINTSAPADSLVIDSSGRILVGTSIGQGNSLLQVQGDASSTAAAGVLYLRRGLNTAAIGANVGADLGSIQFGANDGTVAASIQSLSDATWSSTSDTPGRLVFFTTADGASSPTERMRITSTGQMRLAGAGITFNGDTAAANELDDYEEGSFSPTIDPWNGTYQTQFGRYTKIGNSVSVFGAVSTNGGTGSFGSFPGVGGLPFAGNVNGSAAKGMWFCFGGAQNLGGHPACGPLDGPGNGSVSAFPNWIQVNATVGNWTINQVNSAVSVEYRFFLEYTAN